MLKEDTTVFSLRLEKELDKKVNKLTNNKAPSKNTIINQAIEKFVGDISNIELLEKLTELFKK